MTLSPSVVQLFSMKPSAIPPCTPPRSQNSDSGIESVKSKKQGRANINNNNLNNFRGRGNSDPAVKKLQHNANANKNKQQAVVRASSLSPTKNLHTSSMSPKTAKKANYQNSSSKNVIPFQGAARTPPRFGNGFKKQQSAPAGTGSRSSSHPTAIQTPSSPTFRKKQQSSTAMKTKNNNHIHSKNQDSDSGSASSGSNKSNKTKSFVRTASLHMSTPDNNNQHQQSRQRNDNSFSNTIYRDEMWAGSAASPAATALPQPPIAWLRVKEEATSAKTEDDVETMMLTHTTQKIASSEISARNATTTKSPLATSVQQMFASFNSPLVSTTA